MFKCHKRFCRSYFLDEHVVAQGCKQLGTLTTKHDSHRFAAEVLNDVPCLIWEKKFICTGLYNGIASHKLLECQLLTNTKNLGGCITTSDGMNEE